MCAHQQRNRVYYTLGLSLLAKEQHMYMYNELKMLSTRQQQQLQIIATIAVIASAIFTYSSEHVCVGTQS